MAEKPWDWEGMSGDMLPEPTEEMSPEEKGDLLKRFLSVRRSVVLLGFAGAKLQGARLQDANLKGANLKGAKLQEADFQGAYLWKADLREANLQGADLQGAKLWKADLQGADLQGAKFQGVNLRRANLQKADLREADFQGTKLQGANLQKAKLHRAYLNQANLQGAKLWEADLREADLQKADLREADLRRADLREANLQGADLQGAKLWRANLREADLRRANLQKADLWKADLQRADLQGADLQGARLQGARLQGANLQGADLQYANFRGARLQGADLQGARYSATTKWPENFDFRHSGALGPGANLQGAKLQEVDLQGADLQGADLRGADLQGAKLHGAKLHGAKLQGAKLQEADLWGAYLRRADLKGADLKGARIDTQTYINSGFSPEDVEWLLRQGCIGDELFNQIARKKEGLTLYFSRPLTRGDRFLIDGVIVGTLGRNTDCEVEEYLAQDTGSFLRLQASNQDDLLTVAQVLHEELWRSPDGSPDRQALVELRTLHTSLIAQLNALTATLQRDRTELWVKQPDGQPVQVDVEEALKTVTTRLQALESRPMGDTYNVQNAGAVGREAQANNTTINQYQQNNTNNIDLTELSAQLITLWKAMRADNDGDMDKSDEEDAIKEAVGAAQAGDESRALLALKKVGGWTLGVAEKVGVPLAVAAIKQHVGMP